MQKKFDSVYIIGIGGISLSAIAIFLRNKGIKVYGSDLVQNEEVTKLIEMGFEIKVCPSCKEYVLNADAVVYTSAIAKDNEDILFAKSIGKPIYSRAEVLGFLSKEFKTISISGCHGKTTTTGMIANIFLESGLDPNIHIGGVLKNIDSNVMTGKSDILITEACEYKDSFLTLKNYVSVVLNIKEDHLDYFKNIDNIFSSFQKFVDNTDKNGIKIVNFDDFFVKKLKLSQNHISFGIENNAVVQAKNIKEYSKGRYCFNLFVKGNDTGKIFLPAFGYHNIYNALAAASVAIFFDIDFKFIKSGLENFKGIKRRFEYIGKIKNNLVIHDYAHHPDEIKATLKTCKELGYKKIVAIFQPHTFSRTKDLYDQFLKCFDEADEVWMLPIYPAREKPIKGVTSFNLSKDLRKLGKSSHYFQNFQTCKNAICANTEDDVLFAILGAGDIEKLSKEIKK
jgi:UDP-N-acetylmuramate--alanine ligase